MRSDAHEHAYKKNLDHEKIALCWSCHLLHDTLETLTMHYDINIRLDFIRWDQKIQRCSKESSIQKLNFEVNSDFGA